MKNQTAEKKRKIIRRISLLGIALVLLHGIARLAFTLWLKSLVVPHNASIGIIGGADGPTAIFVTSHVPFMKPVMLALILAVSIWGVYWSRKK